MPELEKAKEELIAISEEMVRWITGHTSNIFFELDVQNPPKRQMAMTSFLIALEHQRVIVELVSQRAYCSAAAMSRLLYDTYVRGMWPAFAATDREVARFLDDYPIPTDSMVKALAKINREVTLSKVHGEITKPMGSFVHCGVGQILAYASYGLYGGITYQGKEVLLDVVIVGTLNEALVFGFRAGARFFEVGGDKAMRTLFQEKETECLRLLLANEYADRILQEAENDESIERIEKKLKT